MYLHRDSQKRIYLKDTVYFLSSATYNRYPFFKEKIFCDLFVENLRLCKQLKGFKLFAWLLGYDHFHLLIQPGDGFNYSEIIHSIKRNVSRDVNKIIQPPAGEVPQPRRYQNINYQIIGEHMDARLREWRLKFQSKSSDICHAFKWQRGFNDQIVRNENDLNAYFEYIKYNPLKHNLSDNWSYVFTNSEYVDLIDSVE